MNRKKTPKKKKIELPHFEPIHIYCPSVAFVAFIITQIVAMTGCMDKLAGQDVTKMRDKGVFYAWFGLWFWFPLIIMGFVCLYASTVSTTRMNRELQRMNAPIVEGAKEIRVLPGDPVTSEEFAIEDAMNKSILMKFFWFSVGCWPFVIKMCADDNGNYSWTFCSVIWFFEFGYYGVIAFINKNWFVIDQRDINRQMANVVTIPMDIEFSLAGAGAGGNNVVLLDEASGIGVNESDVEGDGALASIPLQVFNDSNKK